MSPVKLVFLGSKPIGYQCLQYLLEQREALGVEVAGVLTQQRKEFGSSHDLAALAREHGVPVIASLEELPDCDILYSVQYHQILKAQHIAKAHTLAMNLHMAPLPEYRGCNQFSFAILDGKKEFGATLHRIDTRIDHGDILFQKRFSIPDGCWVQQLYDLTFEASVVLFKETLGNIVRGNYTPIPQQTLEAQYGTSLHYRHEMATLKQIDLAWNADKIQRHIRATSMPGFEPPYCIINGKKIYFSQQPA